MTNGMHIDKIIGNINKIIGKPYLLVDILIEARVQMDFCEGCDAQVFVVLF
jgi:hypothetical protein